MLQPLPPIIKINFDAETVNLISGSEKSLYTLGGAISVISKDHPFIKQLKLNESINSYRIDGSTIGITSYLEQEQINEDLIKIKKYFTGLELGERLLKNVGHTDHILKSIHKEISVAAKEPRAGEFRNSKIWVGNYSSSIENAEYLPPEPEDIPKLMAELDQYISSNVAYPVVVNAALVHAQLEMIHPFASGNGLVGRILLLLHFIWKKKLACPVLQISSVLNKKKNEYFDRLGDLERSNNWSGWIKFFLKCIIESSNKTHEMFINALRVQREDYNKFIEKEFATTASLKLFEYITVNPIVTVPRITRELGFSKQTANYFVAKFLEENILHESTGKQRYRIYIYKKLIDILEDNPVYL